MPAKMTVLVWQVLEHVWANWHTIETIATMINGMEVLVQIPKKWKHLTSPRFFIACGTFETPKHPL